jgi:hypothetical protein
MHPNVAKLSLTCFAVLFLVAALDSCSASIPLPDRSNLSLLPADLHYLTVTDLMKGRELYIDNCGGCHRLYAPGEKTFSEWMEVYKEMERRIHQTASEKEKLLAYLRATSKSPVDTTSYSH